MDTMWIMITVVGAMGTGIPIAAIVTRHRQKIAELEVEKARALGSEETAAYADENRKLQRRVQTLERIVTDKGYGLAEEIDALSDQRLADQPVARSAAVLGRAAR